MEDNADGGGWITALYLLRRLLLEEKLSHMSPGAHIEANAVVAQASKHAAWQLLRNG